VTYATGEVVKTSMALPNASKILTLIGPTAALDTGSAFEGMGAAREVTFACLAEPALFLGRLATAQLSNSLRLADMRGGSLASHWGTAAASVVLVLGGWFIVLLVENCRVPFDDPSTHLELTMIAVVVGLLWGYLIPHAAGIFGLFIEPVGKVPEVVGAWNELHAGVL